MPTQTVAIGNTGTSIEAQTLASSNDILEEKNYRDAVESLMRLKSDKPITNGVPAHAAILYEAFFKNAQNRVRIFCQNLNSQVFGVSGVVEAARQAIKQPTVGIDILIQDEVPNPSPFLGFIEENSKNPRLRLRRVVKESARNAMINFSIMDKQSIRFEKNRNEVRAFAVMFTPEMASVLISKFEEMFSESSEIKIQSNKPNATI